MDDALAAAVATLLRQVAADVVMPRFGKLAAADIAEKSPADLVTIADKESEERLTAGLLALLPDAIVVGEEAAEADPGLLDRVTRDTVWIVDPIDGTANYAIGRAPFAIMVALARGGETQAGWILDPVTGRMCHARLGGGAFVDGERIVSRPTGAQPPRIALATRFLTPALAAVLEARAAGKLADAPVPGCAGEQYPRLVMGEADAALFWRALPWDHAPGALFLEEAGGRIRRRDGSRYRLADRSAGLLAAATPALWDLAAETLFSAPLPE